MGKWTLAFSLFPAPLPRLRPSVNVRTHVSVLTQSAVTVLFFWESGTLIASLWCKPKAKEVAVLTLNRSAKARSFWVAVIWIRAVVSSSIVFAGENQLISQSVQHTHTSLTFHLPINYLINDLFFSLVVFFSALCVRTFVCRDRVPDPAPHINPPSVIDECCHTSTSTSSFLFFSCSLTHSLSHH